MASVEARPQMEPDIIEWRRAKASAEAQQVRVYPVNSIVSLPTCSSIQSGAVRPLPSRWGLCAPGWPLRTGAWGVPERCLAAPAGRGDTSPLVGLLQGNRGSCTGTRTFRTNPRIVTGRFLGRNRRSTRAVRRSRDFGEERIDRGEQDPLFHL